MPEKAAKAKRAQWLVLVPSNNGETFDKVYSGPDKRKARAEAAAEIKKQTEAEQKEVSVVVLRVSQTIRLSDSDLRAELPRDVF